MHRIEISMKEKWIDPSAEAIIAGAKNYFNIETGHIIVRRVFTIDAKISEEDAKKIAAEIANPVTEEWRVNQNDCKNANAVIRIGFRPGVTDNIGKTAKEAISDILGRKLLDDEDVFSSTEYLFFSNKLNHNTLEKIAKDLIANELIETISIFDKKSIEKDGIPHNLPRVNISNKIEVKEYNLEVSDEELLEISRKGLFALSLEEMKSIRNYFRTAKNRKKYGLSSKATDVELEVIAQTWSEHCKHKIFDAEIEYTDEKGKKIKIVSCFKTFIKKSTEEIAKNKKWLVSVFHDNAGVIEFNRDFDLVYKVETHNSPSALDPYGGAITGIVGVNRDPLGTGQGANLLSNVWGYCLASPFTQKNEIPEGLLHPRRLRDGIHKGVIDGGNQSGIPYSIGWEYFDQSYLGKPLVYCGTVGYLPKKIAKVKGYEKSIKTGDLIVMAGGRIGKDGIHGATFSSEELHSESPTQAVQIGDPITQKKLSDFILEARNKNLYRFITDNGAGGLSSSIGEMATQCGGCEMDLSKAPLKYHGLAPWEILLSEAQERMSFAVPKNNIKKFLNLAKKRDVEATVLGKFTNTGKFHIKYGKKTVAYLDLNFMHNGLPRMKLKAKWTPPKFPEIKIKSSSTELKNDFENILSRLNICSNEYKARQYDHEVKGISIIKPFCGVKRDVLSLKALEKEGIVLSSAILPRYSLIDTYHMTASVIDLAVRRILSAGGNINHIAGLDNFCWPDPVQSEKTPDGEYKLAQLVRANQALYKYTKIFGVPCISGKDSMKNDSTRGGKKISILPSLLFSAISRIDDISKALDLSAKFAGDMLCVIGITKAELGASEYLSMKGQIGNNVPKVDAKLAMKIYKKITLLTQNELLHSLHAPALGGLSVGFAKIAIAGRLGMDIDLDKIPGEVKNPAELLFSESNSRFIATFPEKNLKKIKNILNGIPFAVIGIITDKNEISIKSKKFKINFSSELEKLIENYKTPLNGV
ncbi:MAG TPA: AIR synthase-related protein [Victivallales bacterium]|nr:AIR synthase-related protein [Victivallales bacterium]